MKGEVAMCAKEAPSHVVLLLPPALYRLPSRLLAPVHVLVLHFSSSTTLATMRLFDLPTALLALLAASSNVVSATHTSNWAVLVSTSKFWFNCMRALPE